MKDNKLMLLIAIGFEVFISMSVVSEVGPHYSNGDVIRIIIATSIIYIFIGALWGSLRMIENEQVKRDKLREKVITALQSKRKDRINEAIDILNHPNGYPKNV